VNGVGEVWVEVGGGGEEENGSKGERLFLREKMSAAK
jgi:hypothetical protein